MYTSRCRCFQVLHNTRTVLFCSHRESPMTLAQLTRCGRGKAESGRRWCKCLEWSVWTLPCFFCLFRFFYLGSRRNTRYSTLPSYCLRTIFPTIRSVLFIYTWKSGRSLSSDVVYETRTCFREFPMLCHAAMRFNVCDMHWSRLKRNILSLTTAGRLRLGLGSLDSTTSHQNLPSIKCMYMINQPHVYVRWW